MWRSARPSAPRDCGERIAGPVDAGAVFQRRPCCSISAQSRASCAMVACSAAISRPARVVSSLKRSRTPSSSRPSPGRSSTGRITIAAGHAAVLPVTDGRQTTPDGALFRGRVCPDAVDPAAGKLTRSRPLLRADRRRTQELRIMSTSHNRGTGPRSSGSVPVTCSLTTWPSVPAEHAGPRTWRTSRNDLHGRPPENMWWP